MGGHGKDGLRAPEGAKDNTLISYAFDTCESVGGTRASNIQGNHQIICSVRRGSRSSRSWTSSHLLPFCSFHIVFALLASFSLFFF
jgi:hypothetical protein